MIRALGFLGRALALATLVGLAWGVVEALCASAFPQVDQITIVSFYTVLTSALALPLALVLSLIPAWRPARGLVALGVLLAAGACAVPLAIWINRTQVQSVPMLSWTNALLAAGSLLAGGLVGALVGLLTARTLRAAEQRSALVRALAVALPLLALGACAWRCTAVLLPAVPGPWADNRAQVGDRPNVVLIVLDTVRADHLSCYGHARPTTPNLDALPAVRFQRAYAQGHWTVPSTASLLTGLYPGAHHTNELRQVLPPDAITLTQHLARAGYVTGYFTANPTVSGDFGFTREADVALSVRSHPLFRIYPSSLGHVVARKADWLTRADKLNDWVRPFLDSVRDRRFFLYVHYKDPHHPYDPPRPHDEAYDPGFSGRRILDPSLRRQWPISGAERENMLARYDGEIRFLDEQLGQLFTTLKQLDVLGDTLIVVTSDHGEEFADHGGWLHGHSVHDEIIRVPLLVAYPPLTGQEPRDEDARVRLVDVAPTVLDLLQLPRGDQLQGASFVPFLTPSAPSEPRPVLCEGVTTGHVTLLQGQFKLIREPDPDGKPPRLRLYDLSADPDERLDLAASQPERVDQLSQALDEALRSTRREQQQVHVELDALQIQQFKALGYIK